MILSFTAIDKHAKFRNFTCLLPEMEIALDLLSKITAEGDMLITAHIQEEGYRTELPVEAFDGQLVSEQLRKLEKQWQAALKKPVRPKRPNTNWRVDLLRKQLSMYDERIDQLRRTVVKLERLSEQAANKFTNGPIKMKLVGHHQKGIRYYQEYIDRAQSRRQATLERLRQLERDQMQV